MLKHFDTEAVYALIAPRPLLMLSGDRDFGLPMTGIELLEKKLGQVYKLHGTPDYFRSVVCENTAHEYLPEMRERMASWFEKHLAGLDRGFSLPARGVLSHTVCPLARAWFGIGPARGSPPHATTAPDPARPQHSAIKPRTGPTYRTRLSSRT